MGLGCAGKPRAHTSNATAWLWLGSSQIARPALQSHRLTQVTGSGLVSSRRWSAGAGVAPANQPGRRAVMATCSWQGFFYRSVPRGIPRLPPLPLGTVTVPSGRNPLKIQI
jgi:hypothetical protein